MLTRTRPNPIRIKKIKFIPNPFIFGTCWVGFGSGRVNPSGRVDNWHPWKIGLSFGFLPFCMYVPKKNVSVEVGLVRLGSVGSGCVYVRTDRVNLIFWKKSSRIRTESDQFESIYTLIFLHILDWILDHLISDKVESDQFDIFKKLDWIKFKFERIEQISKSSQILSPFFLCQFWNVKWREGIFWYVSVELSLLFSPP
jgi:hypothetical protein